MFTVCFFKKLTLQNRTQFCVHVNTLNNTSTNVNPHFETNPEDNTPEHFKIIVIYAASLNKKSRLKTKCAMHVF